MNKYIWMPATGLLCLSIIVALSTKHPTGSNRTTDIPIDVLQYGEKSNTVNRVAFAHFSKRKKLLARDGQQDLLLVERGPSNVGGRTRAIMFDPTDDKRKKVWAGGTTGGLWYNSDITDPERSWENVGDTWANLSVTWIAADPGDPKKWYVSTGEAHAATHFNGAGLWKTTDAGAHWHQIPETAIGGAFEHIVKVMVSRKGTLFILIRSTSEGAGVWRSTDEGKTWDNVITNAYGADFEITGNGDLIASTFETENWSGALYRSSFTYDGAPGTWDNITPNNLDQCGHIELAVAPSDGNIIYALGSNIVDKTDWGIVSENGGQSWEFFTPPNEINQSTCKPVDGIGFSEGKGGYKLAAAVHPTNPDVLYIGGTDIFKTTDQGDSWNLIGCQCNCAPRIHVDHHTFLFRPSAENEMVLSNDGGVYYSDNAGDYSTTTPSYQKRNKDYNVTQFYGAAMENESGSNYMLAGSQDNYTQKFTAAGYGATTIATGSDGILCFIHQSNSKYQVTSSQNNIVYYSTDGGETFAKNDKNKTILFENPMEYDSKGGILYMAGDNGKMMVSPLDKKEEIYGIRDIGIGNGSITTLHRSPHSPNRMYVGTNNYAKLILSVSGAVNDNMVIANKTGDIGLKTIKSIDFGEGLQDLMAVGAPKLGQDNECRVWETHNAGKNWSNKQGDLPKGMYVNYGLYNPSNRDQVMLATEAGLWITGNFSDDKPEWECFSPNFYVKRLTYREADGRVAISTYGRGLWTTDIFGRSQCPDVYEPNGDWAINAKPIVSGQKVNGTIHKFLDGDFFSFSIKGNANEPGKDISIYFQNKYNLGTVVALLKIDPKEDVPEMLAHEIANKTVQFSGAAPGDYLIWVLGGYSAPETFVNCYDLQLEIGEKGKGINPSNTNGSGSTSAVNPEWIKEDEWLSKMAQVVLANDNSQMTLTLMSFGKPFSVQLVNAAGRPVLEERLASKTLGKTELIVPLEALGKGTYRLKLTDGIQIVERDVVIQ